MVEFEVLRYAPENPISLLIAQGNPRTIFCNNSLLKIVQDIDNLLLHDVSQVPSFYHFVDAKIEQTLHHQDEGYGVYYGH